MGWLFAGNCFSFRFGNWLLGDSKIVGTNGFGECDGPFFFLLRFVFCSSLPSLPVGSPAPTALVEVYSSSRAYHLMEKNAQVRDNRG